MAGVNPPSAFDVNGGNNNQSGNGTASPNSNSVNPVTQVTRPATSQQQAKNSKQQQLGWSREGWESKLIMLTAGLFFLGLGVKYFSLRPNFDIANRIPICGTPGEFLMSSLGLHVKESDSDI